jgi:hypothetical protein
MQRFFTAMTLCVYCGIGSEARAEDPVSPITPEQRMAWVGKTISGPTSLTAGVFVAGSETLTEWPPEWHRSAEGFARRYAARDAAIAMSNSIEAALGAAWGEDPRYMRCTCDSIGSRSAHAGKLAVLAPRRDGHLAPAWARYAGTMTSNVVQNAWLPPSMTEWRQVVMREGSAFAGRFAGNLWSEFWPDVKRRLRR